MWKSLVDIDTRKTTAYLSIFVALALPIAGGQVSLDYVIPTAWIPWVQHDLGFAAWAAGVILGIHNGAALVSPRTTP